MAARFSAVMDPFLRLACIVALATARPEGNPPLTRGTAPVTPGWSARHAISRQISSGLHRLGMMMKFLHAATLVAGVSVAAVLGSAGQATAAPSGASTGGRTV